MKNGTGFLTLRMLAGRMKCHLIEYGDVDVHNVIKARKIGDDLTKCPYSLEDIVVSSSLHHKYCERILGGEIGTGGEGEFGVRS